MVSGGMQNVVTIKKLNHDLLKTPFEVVGRRPASINRGRVAGLATASVNTLIEACHLRKTPQIIGPLKINVVVYKAHTTAGGMVAIAYSFCSGAATTI